MEVMLNVKVEFRGEVKFSMKMQFYVDVEPVCVEIQPFAFFVRRLVL